MAAIYISQADVEARFTPKQVRDAFCDDGSRTPGPRLDRARAEASRILDGILRQSWPSEAQVQALVDGDEAVKGAGCIFVMEIGADAHPEWQTNGKGPYTDAGNRARAMLQSLAKSQIKSAAEDVAGANPTYDDRVTAPEPNLIFTPRRGESRGGGF